jgi:amino acid adenylation domain-containing protein
MERSLEMIIGILGILKAGGAFVPLDPTLPAERFQFIVEDACIEVLVTREKQKRTKILAGKVSHIICPDTQQDVIALEPKTNPVSAVTPAHLAYVIYTSGSTGKPKGVLLNHHGVCNLIKPQVESFDIKEGGRVLQFASLNFDASVSEIFSTLLSGAVLVLHDKEALFSPHELMGILRDQKVNIVTLPPVVLRHLPADGLPGLKTVISAGETCSQEIAEKWSRGRRLINGYGPTEYTVTTTLHHLKEVSGPPPIGGPILNTKVYIVDDKLQPVPIMVPGELCISGIGLARGYLNRPDLAKKKFIFNPFRETIHAPGGDKNMYRYMYKSGDLVRWLPVGNMEFLGRLDNQVKIRGFRIEPGEIEALLVLHPAVRQAAVIVKKDQCADADPRLAAYLVWEPGQTAAISQLRNFLQQKVPAYMVPSFFKVMEALPLTNSGKIDRRKLAQIDISHQDINAEQVFTAPRHTLEFKLCRIWEEVLQVQPVGIRDSFFDLGGHSLSAVKLISRIQQELGQSPSLSDLFKAPSVELAAKLLQEKGPTVKNTPLVTFNAPKEKNKEKPSFFCVHAIGGSVICYRELALCLGDQQPFYGLESMGLSGRESHYTIEEMAVFYIRALKSVQPHGPYYLGGWSFGGMIAFEMACQLKRQGNQMALLALLDAWPPASKEVFYPGWETGELLSFTQQLEIMFGLELKLNIDRETAKALSPDQLVRHIREKTENTGQFSNQGIPDQFHRYLTVFKTHCQAASTFTPQSYPGKVVLFRAVEGAGEPGMDWKHLAGDGVEIHEIPGDHFSILQTPHVQTLTRVLRPYLETSPGSSTRN